MNAVSPLSYQLNLEFLLDEGLIRAESIIEIANKSSKSLSKLWFLLNRGLSVRASSHEFSQSLVSIELPGGRGQALSVNLVEVQFRRPLELGAKCSVFLEYEGEIKGYENVFSYVKDRIGLGYSIVRPDAFSYPLLSYPSYVALVSSLPRQRFEYRLRVEVPRGYRAASLGRLVETRDRGRRASYVYESKAPSWRIDVAVAEFNVLRDAGLDTTVYALPGGAPHARRILAEIRRVLDLYKALLGGPPIWVGYTVIEVPEGWGGQADIAGALIPSNMLRDPLGVAALYHELAHLWSVPSAERHPSRFLDEGIASYLQLVAEERLMGRRIMDRLERLREGLREMASKRGELLEVAISDYGKYGLTDASYTVGAWILHILRSVLGGCFWTALKSLVSMHGRRPASLEDFARRVGLACGDKGEKLATRLLFTSEPARLMLSGQSLEEALKSIEC